MVGGGKLAGKTQSLSISLINKAEVDAFLELSYFFNDPANVGNLNSGSSAFSMTQRDGMGRVMRGGFRMGNTCTPVEDSIK